MLGLGISVYFSLRFEPDIVVWLYVGAFGIASLVVARLVSFSIAPVFMALFIVVSGAGLSKFRTEAVTAPVLTFRYYGPIEGRVVNIDRSASDALRLTLDQTVLFNVSPIRTPDRVRVSVHGAQTLATIVPGDRLIMTGHLSPPSGPAEPTGFDFQRHAWFAGLGAVGYTRTPVLRSKEPDTGRGLWVFEKRFALSSGIKDRMPDDTGAFASAITTGDRSAISQDVMKDLRAANLAHLLAISGLHMGLLTGFIFALLRYGLALIPAIALHWQTKKIAALVAIAVGAGYLVLSGGNVATERAFTMVAVMFCAVIIDRRALTLRAVAIAAVIILVVQPEALMGPGFQMSFAATTALVFVFSKLRNLPIKGWPRWTRAILSVVLSSGIAGLATAPFAAAHFNQMAHFGLIANVLSVPVMGLIVMPAAVLAAMLAPFGLEGVGLWFMDIGLRWIIFVAQTVADFDGAVGHVVAPDPFVLGAVAIGLLVLILWQGGPRYIGFVIVWAGFFQWSQTERPALLVADNAALIGLMTEEGRALSKERGSGFVAGIWLENDGNPVEQVLAAGREGLRRQGRRVDVELGPWRVVHVSGKVALSEMIGCGGADVLISNQFDDVERPCRVFDIAELRDRGALAFWQEGANLRIQSARDVTGVRPWNRAAYRDPVDSFIILNSENGPPEPPILAER